MTIRRSWWKRNLPVKVRHNLGLIFSSVVILIVVAFMLSSFQISPIIFTKETPSQLSNSRYNISGMVDLFDLGLAHNIKIQLPDEALQLILQDYRNEGLKTWVKADVTIDGTLIESVGLRLKGNSSLQELRAYNLEGAFLDNPSNLPLLISFDKYEKGQAYQGREELAIRPGKGGSANLNEALALRLIKDSGQVSQDFTWSLFSLNDSPTATRLVLENPDKRYADSLGLGSGVLFKSRNQNRFRYVGDDLQLYRQDFEQINAKQTHDLSPVVALLKWLGTVSPKSFDEELANWVNIPSFARYVASQELLGNVDDMAGPEKNFLLWYDLVDKTFSVISWDMNRALEDSREYARAEYNLLSGNILKQMFVSSEAFTDEIAGARASLLSLWHTESYSKAVLAELSSLVPVSELLSQEQINTETKAVETALENIH